MKNGQFTLQETKQTCELPLKNKNCVLFITEYAGIGYTFDFGNNKLMAGIGMESKWVLSGLEKATDYQDFNTLGAGLRCKYSHSINSKINITVQLNASYDFKTTISNRPKEAQTMKFLSANALVGLKFNY